MSARRSKKWFILGGFLLLFFSLVLFGVFLVEDPLRRYLEAKMNQALDGYTVTLEGLHLRPVLTMDFENLRILQDAQPDPPVAHFPELLVSIHWRALLSGRLVGDMVIRKPVIFLDLSKIESESKDEVPVEERGWPQALAEMYPFKINRLEVDQGRITYTDRGDDPRPLELSEVYLGAENIRNVFSSDSGYPSEILLRARVFGRGSLEVDGRADFLKDPHIGVKGGIRLTNVDLSHFQAFLKWAPVVVKSGVLESADASMEYAPGSKWIRVHSAAVRQMQGMYVYPGPGQEKVKKAARKVAEKKKGEDEFWVLVDRMHIEESTLGFENTTTNPSYQIFLEDMQANVENYSNGFRKGDASIRLKGKFMGSGPLVLTGAFRPEEEGADLNLNLVIEDTAMPAMNNLFRAYGGFDTAAGWFSLYSEIKVQKGRMEGYVKPLFRDVDIYNKEQEKSDSLFQKVYEGFVGAIAQLLEHRPREELATKTDISGTLENPKADTPQAMLALIRHAFFGVILPGLENEL